MIMSFVIAAIALSRFLTIGLSEDNLPGSFGTQFVACSLPEIVNSATGQTLGTIGSVSVTITPYDARGALVSIKCPLCKPGVFTDIKSEFVAYGHNKNIKTSVIANAGPFEVHNKSLLMTSSFLVSVLINFETKSSDTALTLALPVQSLDNKYILSNHDKNGFLSVVAVSPGITTLHLQNRPGENHIKCQGVVGEPGLETLIQFQVWFLLCDFLTGSFLYASKPVAVFVGNFNFDVVYPQHASQSPTSTNKGDLLEQALPMTSCGKTFVVPGKLNTRTATPFLRIVACYENVKVTFQSFETLLPMIGSYYQTEGHTDASYLECTVGCQVTMFTGSTHVQTRGSNSMVNLVPVRLFSNIFTLSILKSTQVTEQVDFVVILPDQTSDQLCDNDNCGGWQKISEINGTVWTVWKKTVPGGQVHTVYHSNHQAVFAMYIYNTADGRGSISSAGIDLPAQVCATTKTELDDKVDNDCDGNIDEELLDGEDDDFDGRVDEDLGSSPPSLLHGSWGTWSAWDCGVTCARATRYMRFRLCDHPAPKGGGRDCRGDMMEETNRICDLSNVLCVGDCPQHFWGPGCAVQCPEGCLNQSCDSRTGKCFGCRTGRLGDQCRLECPRYHFGTNCSQSCHDYCVNHCFPTTGECDDGVSMTSVLLGCLAWCVIPAVMISTAVYWCRSRDPNRLALKRAIRNMDSRVAQVKLLIRAKNYNLRELRSHNERKSQEQRHEEPVGQTPTRATSSSRSKLQLSIASLMAGTSSALTPLVSIAQRIGGGFTSSEQQRKGSSEF